MSVSHWNEIIAQMKVYIWNDKARNHLTMHCNCERSVLIFSIEKSASVRTADAMSYKFISSMQ